MSNIVARAEALIQDYYDQKESTRPKVNALKAKIREIENSVKVDGDEHHEIVQRLTSYCDPDRIDGNGIRVGYKGTAQYVRLLNQIKELPTTTRTKTETTNGNSSNAAAVLSRIIDGALYKDDRAKDVVRIVQRKIEDKAIELSEAKIILQLFLYEPPNSESRNIGESRLNAAQYQK